MAVAPPPSPAGGKVAPTAAAPAEAAGVVAAAVVVVVVVVVVVAKAVVIPPPVAQVLAPTSPTPTQHERSCSLPWGRGRSSVGVGVWLMCYRVSGMHGDHS